MPAGKDEDGDVANTQLAGSVVSISPHVSLVHRWDALGEGSETGAVASYLQRVYMRRSIVN